MRRFLVVGCGGSGGATMAYLMDQLRSDLAAAGVDGLPRGWQFVHIDVPSGADNGPDGLGNVERQGGVYIGTGPQSGSYATLDHSLAQQLAARQGLEHIATWAPRDPSQVTVPISVGAGQYRALGRMITLSKAATVREKLQRAWDELNRVETATEMGHLAVRVPEMGRFDVRDAPITLVLSSMAGGAGASMALDVCRLLTLVTGLDPRLMGVFMVSADVFDTLPEAARTGVRPNALAMLGEIVASQTGAARHHDVALLGALGQSHGEGAVIPFARVFPVGRFVGAQRTLFGDGTPKAVYRGLGRGLAGLMLSGVATQQFVDYDLGNTGSRPGDRSVLGWGATWDPIPWGSFGFASLSMGRDRYAEYSAQRIARSSVDRLLEGHLQPGNTASGTDQVKALLDSQWERVCADLALPGVGTSPQDAAARLRTWIAGPALPVEVAEAAARGIVDQHLAPYVPAADGMPAAQWVPLLRQALTLHRGALAGACQRSANGWAFDWQQALARRTVDVVGRAVATFGLPYAVALVERLSAHVRDFVMPGARGLAGLGPADVGALPADVEAQVAGLHHVIANGRVLLANIVNGMRGQVRSQVYASAAGLAEAVLGTYVNDVLAQMTRSLGESLRILESARDEVARDMGLARLATDHYTAWPSDGDAVVPARFGEAHNEVLLTSSADFPGQYTADVLASLGAEAPAGVGFPQASQRVVTQVISGIWPTTGGLRPPGGLVEQTSAWRSRVFTSDPVTGDSVVPSQAHFDVHIRPAELLDRARQYVARPDQSFSRFCAMSLRDFVRGVGGAESERSRREREVVARFREVLTLALPLISADKEAVVALHSRPVEYRYKFSSVPFDALPVRDEVRRAVMTNAEIDPSSLANLDTAFSVDETVKRVDVFGSYPNYSPMVFDSVLKPVAEQWGQTAPGGREAFWTWRRARPLDAALPMAEVERRTMVAGWFLGQIVGEVRIPSSPYTAPVEVWSAVDERWLAFPNPLLTPPRAFLKSYDWLPAVLESVLLAIMRCHENPVMSSLRPYRALRAIYDASEDGPASGIIELSAKARFAGWLRTGQSPAGRSRIPEAAEATTVSGRADAAQAWLTRIRDLASVSYLAPGQDGAAGGGGFSTIPNRKVAAQTPIFRDLAPDVFWATGELLAMLPEARARAERPSSYPGSGHDVTGHESITTSEDGAEF